MMMLARLSAFFALMATVAAFAPLATRPMRSASLKMGYENEVGALPPVGFFDPLGKILKFHFLFFVWP